MKRIFHIISHFDMGGAERVALNIALSENPDFEYHIVEVVRPFALHTAVYRRDESGSHRLPPLTRSRSAVSLPLREDGSAAVSVVVCIPLPEVSSYSRPLPQRDSRMGGLSFFHLFPRLVRHCRVVRTIHNTSLWHGMQKTGSKVEAWLQSKNANIAISTSVLDTYQKAYHALPPIIYNGIAPCQERKTYPGLWREKSTSSLPDAWRSRKASAIWPTSWRG